MKISLTGVTMITQVCFFALMGSHIVDSASVTGIDQLVAAVQKVSSQSSAISELKSRIGTKANELKNLIQSDNGGNSNTISTIVNSFGKASGAIGQFSSSNDDQILSGTLDLMEAFSPFTNLRKSTRAVPNGTNLSARAVSIGKIISIGSDVLNLIIGLFGASGGSQTDVADVVRDVVTQALDDQYDQELQDDAAGLIQVFQVSWAYLDGLRSRDVPLGEHEVAALSSHIPVFQGVQFMTVLATQMNRNCFQKFGNSDYETLMNQAKKCAVYVKLYGQLATLQDCILLDMYSVIEETGHSAATAGGVASVKENRLEKAADDLRFLRDTAPEYVRSVAYYRTTPSALLENFLDYIGERASVNDLLSLSGQFVIRQTGSGRFMFWGFDMELSRSSGDTVGANAKFRFTRKTEFYWKMDVSNASLPPLWTVTFVEKGRTGNYYIAITTDDGRTGCLQEQIHPMWDFVFVTVTFSESATWTLNRI